MIGVATFSIIKKLSETEKNIVTYQNQSVINDFDDKVIKDYDTADGKNADFDFTLDLDAIEGAEKFTYVRVEIFGDGGLCISQAFPIDDGSAPEKFEEEEKSIMDEIINFFKGTKIYAIIGEIMAAI